VLSHSQDDSLGICHQSLSIQHYKHQTTEYTMKKGSSPIIEVKKSERPWFFNVPVNKIRR